MLEVCLLGCGGMVPLPDRNLSSLLVRWNGKMILVDCGEATQIGIKRLGWGFKSIEAVCLTHYHADHVAGLPGFLLTLGNSGRTESLTIIGPPPLEYIIRALTVIAPQLPYEIKLLEIPVGESVSYAMEASVKASQSPKQIVSSVIQMKELKIKVLEMDHMIPCFAYCFELSRAGKFDLKRAEEQKIPKEYWSILQKGKEIECNGRKLLPSMVMGPPRKGLKVVYCTDARPSRELVEFSRESDLLVLEGMYGEDSLQEKAVERKHMIFSEAAKIAKESNSRRLWLTHFSPSVKEPEAFIRFAQDIFPDTIIGNDLMTIQLNFID